MTSKSLSEVIEEYCQWMAIANFSPNTIEVHRRYLCYFRIWCEDRSTTTPGEVTKQTVERYQKYLYNYRQAKSGEPLSFESQHKRLGLVRNLFKWLSKNNSILFNPASDIEFPKKEHRLPRYIFTSKEAETVLNQPDVSTPLGIRDRSILETLYSTGVRRMEIRKIHIYDLDMDRGTVRINQGKGRKDRVVPIGERALKWIEKYLCDVRPFLVQEPDNQILFLTARGRQISEDYFTQMAGIYVKKSGLGKKGSCHIFRHTAATLMLENGAEIRYIQEMLGHSSLATTQLYTQISIRKLKEVHTQTHPTSLMSETLSNLNHSDTEIPPS